MEYLFALAYSFLPIANSIAYFPQVAKLYKSSAEESRSMSLSAWFMWLGGSLISLMYGITNLHDPLFCFVSGVGLAWNVITVALIMWKRRADTFARLSSVTINKSEEQELLGA
ncbi:MAG: hypothetical protein PHX61_08505 [Alphaproteobacteria bacterium]|nr:hypothetical protein [Alphaproteobacteria bacterium]